MVKAHIGLLVVEQVFSWTDPSDKLSIDFYIEPLLAGIADGSIPYDIIDTDIDRVWVRDWLIKRELNMLHVSSLTQEQIDKPVLGAWMEDGSVLLIDGSHRYMARFARGFPTITYHLLRPEVWRKHAIIVHT